MGHPGLSGDLFNLGQNHNSNCFNMAEQVSYYSSVVFFCIYIVFFILNYFFLCCFVVGTIVGVVVGVVIASGFLIKRLGFEFCD